ncbi:MAG: enoyl-CoA hydratase/isomerase family protein [Hyphomicrobiaceae bacterium]
MSGSDAIQTGFADIFLPASRIPGLTAELVDANGELVADILDTARDAEPVPASMLMDRKPEIDRYFGKPTIEAILAELQTTTDEWAMKTRAELLQKSPLALKATLAALQQVKSHRIASLEAALTTEFRLCTHLFEHGEFPEGVRALLVDKDKQPRWNPATLADVTPAMVEAMFAPVTPASDEPGLI